jgi:biopolymer transport protein ExbB/TolQ
MAASTSPVPIAGPVTTLRSGLVPAAQAVCAVALSAGVFLTLIAVPRIFGQHVAFEDRLFSNWSLFVCLLLTCWALALLFTRWIRSRRRALTIAESSLSEHADFSTEAAIDDLNEVARRCGDGLLAERAKRAFAHIRRTGDTASMADVLRAEAEAAQAGLDSAYLPVRVFLWAIPMLGLIGTVMGVGQAARGFAALAGSARQMEDLRTDLVGAVANLGGAFETTMVALLLTVVVMVLTMLLQQRERVLLQDVDDFCRLRLLPLMLSDRNVEIRENQATAAALERLRSENAEAYRRNTEQARVYLKRTVKLNSTLLEKLDAIASKRKQSAPATAGVGAAPQHAAAAHRNGSTAALDPERASELRATLEEMRDSIRELKPFLDQMAANLRRHAGEAGRPVEPREEPRESRGAAVGAD